MFSCSLFATDRGTCICCPRAGLLFAAMPPSPLSRPFLKRRKHPPPPLSDNRRPGHRVGWIECILQMRHDVRHFTGGAVVVFCRGIFLCIDFNTFPSSIASRSIIYWTQIKKNVGQKWRNHCWYKWFCGWCGCIRHGFRFRDGKLI